MSTSYVPTKLKAPITLDTGKAACRNHPNPDLWFPDDHHVNVTALRICAGCPIRIPCGEQAIRSGIGSGIYGGLTPEQRDQMREQAA